MNYDDWVAGRLPLVADTAGAAQQDEPSLLRWLCAGIAIICAVTGIWFAERRIAAGHEPVHAASAVVAELPLDSSCGTGTDRPCEMGGEGGLVIKDGEKEIVTSTRCNEGGGCKVFTAKEIGQMVDELVKLKLRQALEELGDGSCLRHVGNLGG